MLNAVRKQSLSESVYRQLEDKIVRRELTPGSALPAEREMSERLGVNRGAVREAIKRLQQAGLVAVRHGGNHVVRDYLDAGGLELLPALIVNRQGRLDGAVVRSIMAMRSALAPEIAATAAAQPDAGLADALDGIVARMRERQADAKALQELALQFWQRLVEHGGNIAFRLAFNSMTRTYREAWDVLTPVLAKEFRDLDNMAAIARAVRAGDAPTAHAAARANVELGRLAVERALGVTGERR